MRSRGRGTARLGLATVAATLVVALPATGAAAAEEPLFDIPPRAAGVPTIHDGDAATTERLVRRETVATSVAVSQQRFVAAGARGRTARHAVLSRTDDFADALAGSSLLGDGPLLLTSRTALDGRVGRELDRILADGATVYLLGGEQALGRAVADAVAARGLRVVRLAGATRVETAVRIATEAQRLSGRREVLVARAYGTSRDPSAAWADAVAAGGLAATLGVPLVVTPTDALHPAVARFVADLRPTRSVVLGGPLALSEAVASDLPNAVRVAGADRTATAVAIATRGWGAATTGPRSGIVVNGTRHDGWAHGLVAAGLSADARTPIVLVGEEVSAPVRSLVGTCGDPQVELAVIGDGSRVSATVRERLDTLDGAACGAGGAIRTQRSLDGFEGCDGVLAYYQELALERVGPWGLEGGFTIMPVEEVADGDAGGDAGGGDAPAAPGEPRDVSGTNVQESGVDEPDIVKTDGDRALAIARGRLQILDLRGPDPVVASTVELPSGDHQLLLSGTRALVLSRSWRSWGEPEPVPEERPEALTARSVVAEPTGTILTLLDVADPARPVTLATSELEGDYRSARMIDDTVRVALQTEPGPFAWTYPEDGSEAELERAAEANREVIRRSTIEDWTATYVARNAAGVTTGEGMVADCDDHAAPPRASELGTLTIATFDLGATGLSPGSSAAVAASSDTVYASTSRLVVATQRWPGWTPDAGDRGTSELHAFDISDPEATTYVASGAVDGFLLNQFSLSEHEGFLRVATTEGSPWGQEPTSSSTLTVLQETGRDLTVVGRVGGLGEGERIFAVRFMGDVAAVVTFRQVDPLYLLDLSDPTRPRVTGELKIPGFSSYLHPVSEDLLVGIGQDADEDGATRGTQVATYDISDRSAPRQVAKIVFPDAHSEAEHDHKAFLHWAAAGLAVLPLDAWREDGPGFHGAVGLDVGSTGSLAERGRVAHPSADEWPATVRRSFVVDQLLYTVSESGVSVERLADLGHESWTPFA